MGAAGLPCSLHMASTGLSEVVAKSWLSSGPPFRLDERPSQKSKPRHRPRPIAGLLHFAHLSIPCQLSLSRMMAVLALQIADRRRLSPSTALQKTIRATNTNGPPCSAASCSTFAAICQGLVFQAWSASVQV